LSGVRYAQVVDNRVAVRLKPNEAAATRAWAERGALLRLGACGPAWCEVSAQGQKGWVLKAKLWGVFEQELRD
ncbi:MAG: SH3 domain-containing protein, partial [Pseudomonadota bacterium]